MTQALSGRPTSRIDHLVVVADNLDQGTAWCEATLGVVPGPGGRHGLMGTHNRLLKIASPLWPDVYLEIIAIDASAEGPPAEGRSRWFGMDDPALRAAVREQPRLVHFVAQTSDLPAACAALAALGEDVGRPVAASRVTPAGVLRWQITLRDDGVPQHGGALPALIAWEEGSHHPGASMPDVGVRLEALTLRSARPVRLQQACGAIGLQGSTLAINAGAPALELRLSTPRGECVLTGGAPSGASPWSQRGD